MSLGLLLVAYNNLLNLWPPFHGRLYVPVNLTLTAGLVALAQAAWGLEWREVGLGPDQGVWLAAGLVLGVAASTPVFAAVQKKRTAASVADDRFAGLSRAGLAYRALVRIPLGTALLEEVAFRGVLFGLMAPAGVVEAALWSSLAFGLWHVAPAHNRLKANGRLEVLCGRQVALRITAAVAATFLAGLGFTWLRVVSGGIAAPIALHATVNSLGMVAAYLANSRTRES
ncbi:MAG TPA: CPBP family intramembrane glutamic endopeptidase [Actinomycetota bacterium]|nr:CPBP family intramembrane glutamic endopeptidase [Actinomycetota bacterium]